jgi:hypothetical protein
MCRVFFGAMPQLHSSTFIVHVSRSMAMKGELFVDFLKTMFKKLTKTKVIVRRNVNFMLNLFYSYDIPHRHERYQRRSIESDKKLLRRHRKHRNDTRDVNEVISGGGSMKTSQKDGVGHKKVSAVLSQVLSRGATQQSDSFDFAFRSIKSPDQPRVIYGLLTEDS